MKNAQQNPQSQQVVVLGSMGWWRSLASVAVLTAVAIAQSACLSSSFEVPRDEIDRLARTAPGERGKHVRAVQRFGTADEPPPAPPWAAPPNQASPQGFPPPVVAMPYPHHPVPSYYYGYGDPYYVPRYQTGVWASSGDARLYPAGSLGGPDRSGGGALAGEALKGAGKAADRENLAATLAAVLVTAIVVGAVLAGTEGARYDGWVAVHPHHPLHVLSPRGHRLIALDELRKGDVAEDETAVLVGHEGAGLWLRGRAPLDRQGLTYHVGGGMSGVQLAGVREGTGGSGEIGLGLFPSQLIGFAGRFQFNRGFAHGGDFLVMRAGGEAQALPLDLGWLHLGGYGGAGYEWVKAGMGDLPEVDENRMYFQAGALAELEWTTRLALYLRYGISSAVLGASGAQWTPDFSIGLTIY